MPLEKLGPYRLEKLLGRGGMGAVYAGVNEESGDRAAVKVLAGHLSDNSDFRERFKGEVETLKKLRHPNIVQLLAYGEEGEHLFYVMELVEGRSLQDELNAGRRYNWREVAKIGIDICRALKHAHDSGVIHRDLKPANLLVDRHNLVKLTDFGIAKLYGGTQITAAGGILGTADYMSPEQADGRPVNARSDLYSLGSVLYALLAGRPPFEAKSLAEVIHNLRYEKPTPVRRFAPDTPEAFETIILQLLEKEPSRRIASAFAVANYLRAMEHALSLETQVGQITPEDLPLDDPNEPRTIAVSGHDVTLVTGELPTTPKPGPSESTRAGGVTAPLEQAVPDYRISAADIGTSVPQSAPRSSLPEAAEIATPPRSRFVTVEEEEALHRRRKRREEDGVPMWALLLGMAGAACLLGGLVVYAMQPASADSLYAAISTAAETGSQEQLQAVDAEVREFLERFAEDPRAAEVAEYRDSLDVARRERQLQIKARVGGGFPDDPAEQAYLEAVRLAEGSPDQALRRFEALVAVFGPANPEDESSNISVELARQQIETIKARMAELTRVHEERITERLDRADALKADSPEEARGIYQGVIELYNDKAWAEKLVERARKSLEN